MHVRRSASGVEVLAPAKLNLFLEILGKRGDGFHEIETLMTPIAWFDTLHFAADESGSVTLTCDSAWNRVRRAPTPANAPPETAAAEPLPTGDDNLVVRAVHLLRSRANLTCGARLHLVKRIPLAAGLAGGSSDAAAALVAANVGWNLGWSVDRLAEIAAELGSDIPFFLGRGAAVCRGRGERLEPIGDVAPLHFVVARPPEGLGTAAVYRACRPASTPQSAGELVAALRAGRLAEVGRRLHNALQDAAASLSRWIVRLHEEFARLDFLGHQMSGSGTSYFGLCRSARHAQRLAATLRSRGVGYACAVASCC